MDNNMIKEKIVRRDKDGHLEIFLGDGFYKAYMIFAHEDIKNFIFDAAERILEYEQKDNE